MSGSKVSGSKDEAISYEIFCSREGVRLKVLDSALALCATGADGAVSVDKASVVEEESHPMSRAVEHDRSFATRSSRSEAFEHCLRLSSFENAFIVIRPVFEGETPRVQHE